MKDVKIPTRRAVGKGEHTAGDITRGIILNHLQSFLNNDVEAVISDYTEDAILMTQTKTYTGPEEIKGFFWGLLVHFPKDRSGFDLEQLFVSNELAYIVWHAKTPTVHVAIGTDTFFIKEGKIHRQTFAGRFNYL